MRDGNRRGFGGERAGPADRLVLRAPGRHRSARPKRRAGGPLRDRDAGAGVLHRRRLAGARFRRRGSPGRFDRSGRKLLPGKGPVADPFPRKGTRHGDSRLRRGKLSNGARSEPLQRRPPQLRDPSRRKIARARHDPGRPRGRARPLCAAFRRNPLPGHRRRATLADGRRGHREGARLEGGPGRSREVVRGRSHDVASIPRRGGQRNLRSDDPGAALQTEGTGFRLGVERVLCQRDPVERKDASEDPHPSAGESHDTSSRNRAHGRLRVLARRADRHRRPLRVRNRLLAEVRNG